MVWNINLSLQSTNSSDLNVNDLSFFSTLQACQWDLVEVARDNVEFLIETVTVT